MNRYGPAARVLSLVLLFTVIGFGVGMLALLIVWGVLHLIGFTPDFWAMTEAVATAVAAATFLGAAVLAYQELNEATSARHLAIADRLFEELNSDRSVAARRWVYLHLSGDPERDLAGLSDTDRDEIKHVLNSLDRVAFLTQRGWIPDDMILPWMSPMVCKSWDKLGPYVKYERARRHEPDYYQMIDALAERCAAWRDRQGLGSKPQWVDKAL